MFYFMLAGASATAGGCEMSPRRPSDAVAMTVAPSGFLHLDIPLCQRSYIHVNTRKKKKKNHRITTHKLRHTHASATFPCCSLKKRWIKGCQREPRGEGGKERGGEESCVRGLFLPLMAERGAEVGGLIPAGSTQSQDSIKGSGEEDR